MPQITPNTLARNDLQDSSPSPEHGRTTTSATEPSGGSKSMKALLSTILNKAKLDSMKNLYASGLTLQEIGNRFSVTREAVRQRLKGHILKSQGGRVIKTLNKNKEGERRKKEKELYSASHGRRAKYNKGCRCELCRKVHADYMRERYRRAVGKQ